MHIGEACLSKYYVMVRPDIALFQTAAHAAGEDNFVKLLRWYRAVNGLPDRTWGTAGSYRIGIEELPAHHSQSLLVDLRRLARNGRHRSRPLDGKPTFAGGRTLAQIADERNRLHRD